MCFDVIPPPAEVAGVVKVVVVDSLGLHSTSSFPLLAFKGKQRKYIGFNKLISKSVIHFPFLPIFFMTEIYEIHNTYLL